MICVNVGFDMEPCNCPIEIKMEAVDIPVKFGAITEIAPIEAETYKGQYIVDPNFSTQVLPTGNKRMTDDVQINAIEIQRVSNLAGGRTVYIGGII